MSSASLVPRPVSAADQSESPGVNVADWERIASVSLGAAALAAGAFKRGPIGWGMLAIGAGLAYRGMTGHCSLYKAMGVTSADPIESAEGVTFRAAVTVNRPIGEVYSQYCDFHNHPRWSQSVESVEDVGNGRTRWTLAGPMGVKLRWVAAPVEVRPNELYTWQATEDADVRNAGTVRFQQSGDGQGTEVHVAITIEPPMGAAGRVVGRALKGLPREWAEHELSRFKQFVEVGQIADTSGQPAGGGRKT